MISLPNPLTLFSAPMRGGRGRSASSCEPRRGSSVSRAPAKVTLAETGSTLINPLFKVWVADYTKTIAA